MCLKKYNERLVTITFTKLSTEEIKNLYPSPYKVKNGCLYKEITNKSGTVTKKLCNFLPYLVSEVSVDDGAEIKKLLKLGGVHESGRVLPEIDVTGAEFASLNWIIERWGADCVLEPERSVKDSVRHAIQLTAENADKKHIYHITGWKLIDNHWEYLLPNDGKLDVSLPGKLSRYEKAESWLVSDLACPFFMTKEFSFAPDGITLPMLAYTFLTPLNEFFHQANCEPKFVLCLLGKTGTRKSTLAALFLSFFGRFTGSDLPLSFRDTANSIMCNAFSLKDALTCIDDFHPGGRKEVNKLTETAQLIMRGYGDRIGRGRLKSDSTPLESRPPQGNAIITAEQAPDIGESGTARYFCLELRDGMIDLEKLSLFQREAERGTLRSCMLAYTEWIRAHYLKDKSNEQRFVKQLKESFTAYRDEFTKTGIRCHGRVPEIYAWLMIGIEFFLSFLLYYEVISEEDYRSTFERCRTCLYDLAKKQSANIENDKPTHKFIQKLYSLVESGQAVLLDRNNPLELKPVNYIGYRDDEYFYLNADIAHRQVKRLCSEQDEAFSISKNGLIKVLAEEGLTVCDKGKNTKSVRIGDKTNRFICLSKEKASMIAELCE